MLSKRKKGRQKEDAELDITSFMNLMIVLVPVLLMMMVFSRITVVELNLPSLSSIPDGESIEQQLLEVEVSDRGLDVFFPQGYLVTNIPMIPKEDDDGVIMMQDGLPFMTQNFEQLQKTLISVKQTLFANGAEKRDIILLLQEDTDYQTIVSLIDKTRSYKAVVVTSVVDAELFPDVSLSEAPKRASGSATSAGDR